MRGMTVQVFDELITGTASTWYTPERFNDVLRGGDCFALQAVTTAVSGSSPTLTIYSEHSEDTEHWYRETAPAFNAQSIANGGSYGSSHPGTLSVLPSFLRFAIKLGGSSPKCRLKLYVTVRSFHSGRSTVTRERSVQ